MEGDLIEDYRDAYPLPAVLPHHVVKTQHLHVVAGWDGRYVHVVTEYEPDQSHFEADRRTRRRPR